MSDITRRDFLKILKSAGVLAGVGLVATPVVAYLYPPVLEELPSDPVLVCDQADLPIGQSSTVKFGRYPAIIIHTQEGLKAYSAVCTHFACLVKWNPDSGNIECPCHQGFFSVVDGSVTSGPPPTPLMRLETEIVDGKIYVKVGGDA